jgi:phenylalanyl-tRNA synthetase beta chain
VVPRLGVAHRPSDAQIATQLAAPPDQPQHAAVVLSGPVERAGWWGPGRVAGWSDAVEAARVLCRAARTELTVRRGDQAPWHPGRCAELVLSGAVIGYAGELHPRVVSTLGLPERTCAMELNLDAFRPPPPAPTPDISPFPPVLLDVALVVPSDVAAHDVLTALRSGAGELLESVRLFDVYADADRLGRGVRSLAFALRFRAADRTLTIEEATLARDAAIAQAAERFGARLRT